MMATRKRPFGSRERTAWLLGVGAALLTACSATVVSGPAAAVDSGGAPPSNDGGSDGSNAGDGSTDGAAPDADRGWLTAAHRRMPQVQNNGGAANASPVLTSVTFPAYDLVSVVDAFVSSLGTSDYWSAATREYGVGATSASTPVHLSETAPTSIDDTGIKAWLSDKLDGTHPEFGTPTSGSIYVIFYPSSTSITLTGTASCDVFTGYHNSTELTTGRWAGLNVNHAVVPECHSAQIDTTNATTAAASHELIEAATDPLPLTNVPAWSGVDTGSLAWQAVLGGGEVGDLCAAFTDSFFTPPGLPYFVQRTWSNANAAAGHDPCQPKLTDEVYFNAAPVMTDRVTLSDQGQDSQTDGVLIPIGEKRTIEVDLYSDGPMAPWTVTAVDSALFFGGGPYLRFSWDATTGANGTKLSLTIEALASTPLGGEPFLIESIGGGAGHAWIGYVAQR